MNVLELPGGDRTLIECGRDERGDAPGDLRPVPVRRKGQAPRRDGRVSRPRAARAARAGSAERCRRRGRDVRADAGRLSRDRGPADGHADARRRAGNRLPRRPVRRRRRHPARAARQRRAGLERFDDALRRDRRRPRLRPPATAAGRVGDVQRRPHRGRPAADGRGLPRRPAEPARQAKARRRADARPQGLRPARRDRPAVRPRRQHDHRLLSGTRGRRPDARPQGRRQATRRRADGRGRAAVRRRGRGGRRAARRPRHRQHALAGPVGRVHLPGDAQAAALRGRHDADDPRRGPPGERERSSRCRSSRRSSGGLCPSPPTIKPIDSPCLVKPGTAAKLHKRPTDSDRVRTRTRRTPRSSSRRTSTPSTRSRRPFTPAQSRAVLVVLQAIDAGGKDSTIRHVFGPLNPQGVNVSGFKVPDATEAAHDYLWRYHLKTPEKWLYPHLQPQPLRERSGRAREGFDAGEDVASSGTSRSTSGRRCWRARGRWSSSSSCICRKRSRPSGSATA